MLDGFWLPGCEETRLFGFPPLFIARCIGARREKDERRRRASCLGGLGQGRPTGPADVKNSCHFSEANCFLRSREKGRSAVAAIIAGWALAQSPIFLEGLTVREAAAGRDTLVAVVVAVLAGAAILFPSLALLFRLVLGGTLGGGEGAAGEPTQTRSLFAALAPSLLPRVAIACLVAGIGFLTIADAGWAHAVGVLCLLAFIVVAFPAALPPDLLPADSIKNQTARKTNPR